MEKAEVLLKLAGKGRPGHVHAARPPGVHGGVELRYLLDYALVHLLDGGALDELDPDLVLVAGDQRGKVLARTETFEVAFDLGGQIGVAQNEPLKPPPIEGHEVEALGLQQPGPKQPRQEVAQPLLERVVRPLVRGTLIGHQAGTNTEPSHRGFPS